jgi:hypothetical protein
VVGGGAPIGVLGLAGSPIGVLSLAGASFEAARKQDSCCEHRHCEAAVVCTVIARRVQEKLVGTSEFRRSNLL